MLRDVSTNFTERMREVRIFLIMVNNLSTRSPTTSSPELSISKGLFFVHLYGVFEYAVTTSVQKTLAIIDSESHCVSEFKLAMLSLVLDSKCRALNSVGLAKMWQTRIDLFSQITNTNTAKINNMIIPTDGSNIKYKQLQSIWTTLCVQDPAIPRPILQGRLEELAEHRNAIAHGRESPAIIGSRFTTSDLQKRLDDINELCIYIIDCLERYLVNKDYLK